MKYTKLFLAAALSAMMFSCTKEQTESEVLPSGDRKISQIVATFADDGVSALWSPGDEISVMYGSAKVKFTAANETPSQETIFTSNEGILFGAGEENYIWAACPHSETNKLDGNTVTLSVPSAQTSTADSFAPGTFPTVGRSHTAAIAFYNVCGGVCFSLTQSGVQNVTFRGNNGEVLAGTVKVQFNDSGVPEVTEVVSGATSIQLNAPTSAGFEVGKLYYFSVLPQTLSNGFMMEFNKVPSQAVKNSTSSVTIKRSVFGKLSNADQGLEYKSTGEVKDLSSAGTANCYIVNKVGNYKFKATVKGGSTESVGTPASADLLWESFGTDVTPNVGDLVNSVSLNNGYVKFTASDKKGNAVIAVKDASGNILWSWHIWLTDDPVKQVYNNSAGKMMDRNLGATSATPGDVHALGLLYQWGRKDPFLSGCQTSYKTWSNQQLAASTLSWPSSVESNSSNGTIAYAVTHPTTFITDNSNNYDWYYTGSSSTDNTRWQTSDKEKGMYDPCPAGWRVPDGGTSGVWSKAFGSSSWYGDGPWDSTKKGMNFGSGNGNSSSMQLGSAYTIWYPAAGSRRCIGGGSLYNVGDFGDYWSCSCSPDDYRAYYLDIGYNGFVYPSFTYYRAYGQSVRCLSE